MPNHFSKLAQKVFLQVWICTIFLLPCFSNAVDKKLQPSKGKNSAQTFKIAVDLVSVNVSVTDKKGLPIKDLTQNDFQVIEEGVPQQLSVFRVEASPGVLVPLPPGKDESSASIVSTAPLSRKVILFVDDYHLDAASLARVKTAGERFIRTALAPTDVVALITASGKNSTEFTKYRDYVISNLNQVVSISAVHQASSDCPPLSDYQAYLIGTHENSAGDALTIAINDTISCMGLAGAPNAYDIAKNMVLGVSRSRASEITDDTRRSLYSIQALARRLRAIPGQKSVVFLSDGFVIQDLTFELQNSIDGAIRANTVIYSINARGLDATPPGGDAGSSIPFSPSSAPVRIQLANEERVAREDPLNALAADTGGKYFRNNNDLFGQMKSAVNRLQVSYILGYYSTDIRRDGRFRKISVQVARPDVVVSARKGYFAPKGEETFQAEKNEDVREALQTLGDLKEIPVSISFNIARNDPVRSQVSVQTLIDVRKIHFQKRENRNQNIFTIVTVVYDANDRYLEGRETQIDFNLTDPNYGNVMQQGLKAQANFRLGPGTYKVKAVVREGREAKMGSASRLLEVPD